MRIYLLSLSIILVILGMFMFLQKQKQSNYQPIKQQIGHGQATIGGDFTLIDVNGQPFSSKSLIGKHVMIYFGFTFCPDICPLALHNISQALDQLSASQLAKIAVLFITLDPERDNQLVLRAYLQNFHPKITALTGTQAEIEQVISLYKVYVQKNTQHEPYLLDHSSLIYLLDKEGFFVHHFTHSSNVTEITNYLKNVQ